MPRHKSRENEHLDLTNLLNLRTPNTHRYDEERRAAYTGAHVPGQKTGFEQYALARLFDERETLGVDMLSWGSSARVDGVLRLKGVKGQDLAHLLEIKTTLSWQSLNTAFGEFVSAKKLLAITGDIGDEAQGLLVFSEFSPSWSKGYSDPLHSWAKLNQHFWELSDAMQMAAVQLTPQGFYSPFMRGPGERFPLLRLFDKYQGDAPRPEEFAAIRKGLDTGLWFEF